MLLQKNAKIGLMRPVYFISKVMKATKKNYTFAEQMVLALMFAIVRFRSYLLPRHFTVITIEETFPYVLQYMDVYARISKWVMQLQEFNYSFAVEDSTRASLADILTHRHHKKKSRDKRESAPVLPIPPPTQKLENAYSLYFDGAYKKKQGQAAAGMVVFEPSGKKIFEEGKMLQEVNSNNEAEYAAITMGLEWCLDNNIQRVNIFGGSMLLIN